MNKIRSSNKHHKINCVIILFASKTSCKICSEVHTGIKFSAYRATESKISFHNTGRDLKPVFNQDINRDMVAQYKQLMSRKMAFCHVSLIKMLRLVELGPQADTAFHVDDVAVFRQAIN